MSNDPIVITKENDGDTINFFEESSDDSEIQLQRRPVLRSKHRSAPTAAKSTSRVRSQRPPSVPSADPAPPTLNDNMFEVFTNPDKKRQEDPEDPEEDPMLRVTTRTNMRNPGFFRNSMNTKRNNLPRGLRAFETKNKTCCTSFIA